MFSFMQMMKPACISIVYCQSEENENEENKKKKKTIINDMKQ